MKNRKSISIVGVFILLLLAITAPALSAGARKLPVQLKSPSNIVVTPVLSVGDFTVSWSAVPNASSYTVRVFGTSGKTLIGEPILLATSGLTVTKSPNTTYRVTVQAISSNASLFTNSPESGKYSVATYPYSFTTAPTPTLCASPQVGVSCAAATGGTWDPSATLAYQWQISDDGSTSWTDIGSATSSSYTPVSGDLNKFLLVRVTGTYVGYTTTTKDSAASSAVAAGTFTTAPTPTLCASPQVGVSCAAATGGTWDPSATLAYQWQISDDGSTSWTDIGSATSSSYTPVSGDLNKFLLVRVTGTYVGYTTTTKDSAASSAVAAGTPVIGSTGPGGGIIFYYDSAGFNCGTGFTNTGSPTGGLCHYLEYAPDGWAPNDLHDWRDSATDIGVRSTLMNDPLLLWSPNSVWESGGGQPGFVTTSITAVEFTSATATYTSAGHTFRVGDKALIAGFDPAGYNGLFTIAEVTSNTFTVANTTNLTVVDGIGTVKTNRKQIGAGRLNTLEIQTAGDNTDLKWAYNSVLQYSGGTQTDWYIPSVYELRELCKWANGQTTGDTTVACVAGTISSSFTQGSRHASGSYWSSNQSLESDYRGVLLNFTNPSASGVSGEADYYYSNWSESIRPIRAF